MSERFRLDGRVALVTGAGSERGIGREIACVMRLAGARVALADLDGAGAHRNASELGDGAAAIQVEVTDPASVAAAIETVHARLGPIDVLVCAAGLVRATPLWEVSLSEFDLLMAVNVRGAFVCMQAVLPTCGPAAGAGSSS